MTSTYRLENGERPDASLTDTDNGFFFEWRGHCDADDCEFREVAYTKEHAEWMVRSHPCPMQYHPPRRYNYLSIAEFYWIELDGVVDEIMLLKNAGFKDGEALAKLQGRASGLAYAVMKACQPYYPDETAVSKQAGKRWKQRNGQEDWEPTPGFKYDPPVPGMQRQYKQIDAEPPTYTRGKVDRVIGQLGTKKVGDIKRALENGMFSAKDLARVYSIDADVIEAIAKS